MQRMAVISPCKTYRYLLGRDWDTGKPWGAFVMLNPSTADAEKDDPTIRRCISFARREGWGGLVVANLFAFRATSPKIMLAADYPIGPDNDTHLEATLKDACAVICAWGINGAFMGRDAVFRNMSERLGVQTYALGFTKDGHPRHPLYLPDETPLLGYT